MLTNQLRNYIAACFSGLWIETFEPDEAIREIETLCDAEAWSHTIWDISVGDPLSAVKSAETLGDGETPQLIVLRNFHRFLGSIEVVQAVEQQIQRGKTARTFLVVLAPVVQIPVELEKLFVVVEHPLPDKEQLRQIATDIAGELPDDANTTRVIEAAPSLEWKLLIALSRFAGLRIPSEPRLLKWSDVNLAARTLRITSPKNERHAGRKYRTCPITADLLPYLEAAAKAPHEPDGFVFSESLRSHTNPGTELQKIIVRAGVSRWKKIWHNLRFSCYSDFVTAGEAPANVSKWLGNTDVVALRHYHDSTPQAISHAAAISFVTPATAIDLKSGDVDAASKEAELCGDVSAFAALGVALGTNTSEPELGTGTHSESHREGDGNCIENVAQKTAHFLPESGKMGRNDKNAKSVKSLENTAHEAQLRPTKNHQTPPIGIEPTTYGLGNRRSIP